MIMGRCSKIERLLLYFCSIAKPMGVVPFSWISFWTWKNPVFPLSLFATLPRQQLVIRIYRGGQRVGYFPLRFPCLEHRFYSNVHFTRDYTG